MIREPATVEKPPLTRDQKREFARDLLNRIEAELVDLAGLQTPHWDARNDLLKNIIQLGSASIVLTVTFTNSFKGQVGASKYFLFASRASFLISIMAAILSLWFSTKMRSLPTVVRDQRARVKEALDNIELSSQQKGVEHLKKALMEGIPNFGRYEIWASNLLKLTVFSFLAALIFLGVVGANLIAT